MAMLAGDELPRTGDSFHLPASDPQVEPRMSLVGVGLEGKAGAPVGSLASRVGTAFDQAERAGDDDDSQAGFDFHHWQGFYDSACNLHRGQAYACTL